MDEINFKDIRVLPGALDLKNNVKKNLAEILSQLQTGSVLKASIVGKSVRGETIFQTSYGRFTTPNNPNLKTGDTVTIRIINSNNQLSGTISSINNQNLSKDQTLPIQNLKLEDITPNLRPQTQNAINLDLTSPAKIPQTINGQISYLNLSKISQEAILYKELVSIKPQTESANITFRISSNAKNISSGFVVKAEVKEGTSQTQLLRTDFGIITVKDSKMPVGTELTLEIIGLNNKPVTNNLNNNVTTLVLSIAKNLSIMQNLLSATNIKENLKLPSDKPPPSLTPTAASSTTSTDGEPHLLNQFTTNASIKPEIDSVRPTSVFLNPTNANKNLAPQAILPPTNTQLPTNSSLIAPVLPNQTTVKDIDHIDQNIIKNDSLAKPENEYKHPESQTTTREKENILPLNKAIRELGGSLEEIKKITEEYSQVKELLIPNVKSEETNPKWQNVFIPFWNGQAVEEKEIQITRSRANYLRFIFNISLEDNGTLQLDGLVKFRDNSKLPVNFDMIFRSNQKLSTELQNKISDIFVAAQKSSGINGQMHFEETEDL